MLMYGICCNAIKNIKWNNVIELVKDFDKDVYQSLLEDLDNNLTDENLDDWISNYETEGRYGIGAFLRDYINQKEVINIDIDDPDGTFIGISAGAPWEFDQKLRTMTESDFNYILSKYINMITDDVVTIQWWKVDDDLDW